VTTSDPPTLDLPALREVLARVHKRLEEAKERLKTTMAAHPSEAARVLAQLSSTEKREAQFYFALHRKSEDAADHARMLECMRRARSLYWRSFALKHEAWTLVQYLAMSLVLERLEQRATLHENPRRDAPALWMVAETLSVVESETGDNGQRAWAFGNLVELYILAPLVHDRLPESRTRIPFEGQAIEAALQVVSQAGPDSFHVFSTRRQVQRYVEWFVPLTGGPDGPLKRVRPIADLVLQALPAGDEPDWKF
jgi:hypothetical protein